SDRSGTRHGERTDDARGNRSGGNVEAAEHVKGRVPGADAPQRGAQPEVRARPAESGAPGHDRSRVRGADAPQRGAQPEVRARQAEGSCPYIATHELDSGLPVGSCRDRRRRDVRSRAARQRLLRPTPASRHAPRGDDTVTTTRKEPLMKRPTHGFSPGPRHDEEKEHEMSNASKWLRTIGALLTLGVVAVLVSATTPAQAEGVTPETLAAAGWD